jgi:hypothetical protein
MTIERPHTQSSLLSCYCHVGGLCYVVRVAKWFSKQFIQNIVWDICTSDSTPHLRDYWSFSALEASHIFLIPLKPRDHCSKHTTIFHNNQPCSLSKKYIYVFCVIFAIKYCYLPLHRASYLYSAANIIRQIIFIGR